MISCSNNPSPIFLKIKKINDESDFYERKIRLLQNEFAGDLKQEDAAVLLNWISTNQKRGLVVWK